MRYNEAKFNGISFWLKGHDYGRRAKMADNEVLFEDEEQKRNTSCKHTTSNCKPIFTAKTSATRFPR